MTSATLKASGRYAFRDFVNDGQPGSGANNPDKGEIRGFVDDTAAAVSALELGQSTGSVVFATKAQANAALGYPANTRAEVFADANPALNGVYQKQGAVNAGSWLKISDLAVTVLDTRLDAAEVNIADNTAAIQSLRQGARRLPFVVDWTDPVQAPASWSPGLAGSTFSVGEDDGEFSILRLTASDGVIGSTVQRFDEAPDGVLIEVTGYKTGAAVQASDVFAIGFPTTDAGEWGADTLFFGWRSDGVCYYMNRLGQSLGSPAVVYDQPFGGLWPGDASFVQNDVLSMRMRLLDDGKAVVSLFKNDEYVTTYSAPPGNLRRVAAAWRTTYNAGADYRIGRVALDDEKIETPTTVFISEDETADDSFTANGRAPSTPYRRMQTAAMRFEEHGSRLKVILRGDGDDPIRGGIQAFAQRFREIHIVADKGYRPAVYASRKPVWTRPDAGNYPNVWSTQTRYRNVPGNTSGIGAIYDRTSTPLAGKPWVRITDAGANTSIATMNGAGQRGTFSIQTAGAYTGDILIHAPADADPNALDLEVPEYASALQIIPAYVYDAAHRYGLRLIVEGIDFGFSADNCAWLDRLYFEANDCSFMGAGVNNSLYANNCSGIVNESRFLGSHNDGWNLNAIEAGGYPLFTGDDGIAHRFTFNDCEAFGHFTGDGGSNHARVFAAVNGGRYHHNFKHGLSMTESFSARGVEASANANGAIFFAPPARTPAVPIQGAVTDCVMTGSTDLNSAGLALVTAAGAKARLLAVRNTIRDNVGGSSVAILVQGHASNANADTVLDYGDIKVGGNTSNTITQSGPSTLNNLNGAIL